MNFKWNKETMLQEIKQLEIQYKNSKNIYERVFIKESINNYSSLLNLNNVNVNNNNLEKYAYEEIINKNCINFSQIFNDNQKNFLKLVKSILNLYTDEMEIENQNKFIIDTKLLEHIKIFTKQYDINLYNYFNYLYNNNYIRLNNNKLMAIEYAGLCYTFHSNKKSYIEIFPESNCLVAPTIVHEIGHAYNRIQKPINIHIKSNYSMYTEVFSTFLELLFSEYLENTKYSNIGVKNILKLMADQKIAAENIEENITKEDENVVSNWLVYYGYNIALAFKEQYKINPKEAKSNLNYFIKNNNITHSDKLLSECEIDLNKLYNAEYFKTNYYENKKRIAKVK